MTSTQEYDVTTLNLAYIPPAREPAPAGRPDPEPAELARAMEEYKCRHNRPFPTWSEVLEVLRGLGYEKRADLSPVGRHRVRINRSGRAAEQIRSTLARFGGVPLPSPEDGKYGFLSEQDRDRALDAVRADQGWTCIEPQ